MTRDEIRDEITKKDFEIQVLLFQLRYHDTPQLRRLIRQKSFALDEEIMKVLK